MLCVVLGQNIQTPKGFSAVRLHAFPQLVCRATTKMEELKQLLPIPSHGALFGELLLSIAAIRRFWKRLS